jgi:hypothetical protein
MRTIITLLVTILLAGCAAPQATKSAATNVNKQSQVANTYKKVDQLGAGYFVLVEKLPENWKVVLVSRSVVRRQNSNQEILFISRDTKFVQPFFTEIPLINHAGFHCSAFSDEANKYSPCGASIFSSVAAGSTVLRNLVSVPLTFGIASGTVREVNYQAVAKVVEQTNLIDSVKILETKIQQVNTIGSKIASLENQLLSRAEKDLVATIQVNDPTGLFPKEPKVRVRLSIVDTTRSDGNTVIRNIHAGQFDDVYRKLDEFVASQDEVIGNLVNKLQFKVDCSQNRFGQFTAKAACAETVTAKDALMKVNFPVAIQVLALNVKPLTPRLELDDTNLRASVSDLGLMVQNKSNSFLEIQELSCYVDNEISTKIAQPTSYRSLPPQAAFKTPVTMGEFCFGLASQKLAIEPIASFRAASGRFIEFGVAIKYRKGSDSNYTTLFKKSKISLDEAIQNSARF